MKPTLVVAGIAAAALALAPMAQAKELKQAQVCGTDGCTAVEDGNDRMALADGGPPRTPPTAAPFYRIKLELATGDGRTEGFEVDAVPARRALRADDGTWMDTPAALAEVLDRAARGHRPFAAADLMGAAAAPTPAAPAADAGSALWPEGVLLALGLLGATGLVVRRARGPRSFGPASG